MSSRILNWAGVGPWQCFRPKINLSTREGFQLNILLCSEWFFSGRDTPSALVHISMVPLWLGGRGGTGCCNAAPTPSWVPMCRPQPASACCCQKRHRNETHGEKSRPTAAIETTLENSYVWVTVINVMLIPTKTMGEKPCANIYNQLMKNATPIRAIITMKNHPENTQATRPWSHCLVIGKVPPFKLIQFQNAVLRIQC